MNTAFARARALFLLLPTALLLLLGGCRDDATATSAGAAATGRGAATPVARRTAAPVRGVFGVDDGRNTNDPEKEVDHEGACAPQAASIDPMELLAFTLTDAIDDRNPSKKLRTAKAGQRVYAHLRLRNRSGRKRCVRVQFTINGEKRPAITLKVGKSWSWRTWAYSTSRSDDRGYFEVLVTDDQGYEIANERLPIRPAG